MRVPIHVIMTKVENASEGNDNTCAYEGCVSLHLARAKLSGVYYKSMNSINLTVASRCDQLLVSSPWAQLEM